LSIFHKYLFVVYYAIANFLATPTDKKEDKTR